MSLINISQLTFAYDGSYDNIFDNLNLRLDTDWKCALIGRNGRGKTTLLRLLMGEYKYSGSISASVDFEYFPYPVPDKSLNTIDVVENIIPDYLYWQLSRELSLLNVDEEVLYRPFETLSNGEQTKVLLAVLFLKENSFLLIDEPTNHLDIKGRETVGRYLNSKKGFLLISHDRSFLDQCTDHIVSINKSGIEIQKGNFSSWQENKKKRDSFEIRENEKLSKEIGRLKNTVKEKSDWSQRAESRKIGIDPTKVDNKSGYRPLQGAKSKKLMSRAKAINKRLESAVEEKFALLHDIEKSEALKISQLSFYQSRLVSARNLSVNYGDKKVFDGLTFEIDRGDRVALCGGNGSGKSSLIKLICGENIPHTGSFETAGRIKISLVPQDISGLSGNLSGFAADNNIDETLFKTILRKLDFSREQFEVDIKDFSFGQRKKVLIAKSLCEQAHLYIWDEPLNYIDVISRMQIEALINSFKPTMLFVEHDKAFCDAIATKAVSL